MDQNTIDLDQMQADIDQALKLIRKHSDFIAKHSNAYTNNTYCKINDENASEKIKSITNKLMVARLAGTYITNALNRLDK